MFHPNLDNIVEKFSKVTGITNHNLIEIYLFPQAWPNSLVGFDEGNKAALDMVTSEYTTIVGSSIKNIWCVFVKENILYCVDSPKNEFYIDLKNKNMCSQREASKRYGDGVFIVE